MNKLAQACELWLEDWSATFPETIPEPEYSKKHEKWKKKLFDKMRDGYYHRFTTRTIKAMLVATIISVLLLTAFVIPSSREFILDKFDEFSAFQLTEKSGNFVSGEITVGYIPDGYEFDTSIDLGSQIIDTYRSENGKYITISKYSSSMKIDFDTENYISEEIIVDNIKYVYCKGNLDVDNLIWTKNDYVYRIDGALSKEGLLKIAKTIK